MKSSFAFDPLLPIWLIIALTVLILAASMVGEWRGLKSSALRAIAAFTLCGALLNPQKLIEDRTPLPDIALVLVDQSESMQIGKRAAAAQTTEDKLKQQLSGLDNLETVFLTVPPGSDGTKLTQVLIDGLGQLPADRLAGVIAITDGRVHDLPEPPQNLMPDGAPFHAIIVGVKDARDRRLEPLLTPRYGLVGEKASFEVQIDDPGHDGERAMLEVHLNGVLQTRFSAVIGNKISIPLEIEKRGVNTVEIIVETVPGELTPLNNLLVAELSGVRDRLRVLLITGEPHMGGRAWRNLLKSDPSVDLVQFTILHHPGEKARVAKRDELSLIEFPVDELFVDKIHEFDLIIFDQYKRRTQRDGGRSVAMLKPYYISNIARYVENGGALLVATGPAYAGEQSLARSPLIAVLPARPTGEIDTDAFRPNLSKTGKRHPITAGFNGETAARWGRWHRTIDSEVIGGDVLMVNDDGKPLLVVDKNEKGRTAMLLSDHAWLWAKGYNGGGPYNEMFRRLSHWLMGEPDLEAERLGARIENGNVQISYFTLEDGDKSVELIAPDGSVKTVKLKPSGNGHYQANSPISSQGAYRVKSGALTAIAAAGALNPREYKHLIPTQENLKPLIDLSGGGVYWAGHNADVPDIRKITTGKKANGKNFAGLISHEQYEVINSRRTPFGPTWLYFLIILIAMLWAWRAEGK